MPDPIDITDGLPVEQPPTQEAPVAEPVEAAPEPETIPYRGKSGEAQIPADAAAAVAAALGFENPAALVNRLRMAEEADDIYKDARRMYRASQQRAAQPDPYYQAQEAQRQQQQQQYRQPQRPQYQAQEEAADDPLALIRAMRAELSEVRQASQSMAEFVDYQRQQAVAEYHRKREELVNGVNHEYVKLVDGLKKKNTPEWKIPERDQLLWEAEQMGMYNSTLSPGEIINRTYRIVYGDDIAQEAAANALQAARSPKARVTVSTGKQVQQPPAPSANTIAGMEAALGGLHFRDIADNLPQAR